MLQTTNESTRTYETQSTQATKNEKNQGTPSGVGSGGVDRDIKNLSSVIKSAKSKKPNFAKANSGTDFLTPEAKKAFIHLQKAFTKALIPRLFDPECHIQIEIDDLRYAISGILSQITSDQHSSGHVTNKDPIPSKSKISQ